MAHLEQFIARSTFDVPVDALFAYHERPGAIRRLTPPWEELQVLEATGGLQVGARVVARMWVGPLAYHWVAEHTAYEKNRLFRDEQREGPFTRWVHSHRFFAEGANRSTLEDVIDYELPLGRIGTTFGSGVARRRLAAMFGYRHAVTRLDLARQQLGRPVKIAMTGVNALLGQHLVPFLTTAGHQVRHITRRAVPPSSDAIAWEPERDYIDRERLEDREAVIHLHGAQRALEGVPDSPLAEDRRIRNTRQLCQSLAKLSRKPKVLICLSSVAIYGDSDDIVVEQSPLSQSPGAVRLAAFEDATRAAREAGIRVVYLRLGTILTPRGGVLARVRGPLGLASEIGGRWLSWVSVEDVLGAINHVLFDERLAGPVNVVSPDPVRWGELRALLRRLEPNAGFIARPVELVRGVWSASQGEQVVSQRAAPSRLLANQFAFVHPTLEECLRFLLGHP